MEFIMVSGFQSAKNHRARGFTMIDVMGAMLLIGLALGGVVAANGRAMAMLKSAKQAAVASKCLQQRIEQIRNYNWTQVTDAAAIQSLYSTPPLPSTELPGFSEQIQVSAFVPSTTFGAAAPAPAGSFLQVARAVDGTVTLASDNVDLVNGPAVRVNVQISWPGPGGRARMRETSVIVANGGIGR
jgi:type II secretory pathway pseudopilin PulG